MLQSTHRVKLGGPANTAQPTQAGEVKALNQIS